MVRQSGWQRGLRNKTEATAAKLCRSQLCPPQASYSTSLSLCLCICRMGRRGACPGPSCEVVGAWRAFCKVIILKLQSHQPARARNLRQPVSLRVNAVPTATQRFSGPDPISCLTTGPSTVPHLAAPMMTHLILLLGPPGRAHPHPGPHAFCPHCLEHTSSDARMLPARTSLGSLLTSRLRLREASPDCPPLSPCTAFPLSLALTTTWPT